MNAIINAYANVDDYQVNRSGYAADSKIIDGYLRASFVSLVSAKMANPECEVILITNIEIPDTLRKIYAKEDIKIFRKNFNNYIFEKDMCWSLAFYKLCALEWAVNNLNYNSFLLVDTDTYFNKNCFDMWNGCLNSSDMWKDAEMNTLMLYSACCPATDVRRKETTRDYYEIYNENVDMPDYGGEFILGKKDVLIDFCKKMNAVYQEMIKTGVRTEYGDEFIINSAVVRFNLKVKPSNAYVRRYWIKGPQYNASTDYQYIAVWHLPTLKQNGIPELFNYYLKHGNFPPNNKAAKMLNFPKSKLPMNLYRIKYYLRNRMSKL